MNYTEQIIENLKGLKVKCRKLQKRRTPKDIWEKIYENNLYEINKYMIESYFNRPDFWSKSYTYISSIPYIKEYIDNNITEYFSVILSIIAEHPEDLFYDSEEAALGLINCSQIEYDAKWEYVSRMKTDISNIQAVFDHRYWDILLTNKLIPETVDTILSYFNYAAKNELNKERIAILVKFINNIQDLHRLDFSSVDWNKYDNMKKDFYKFLISCKELTPNIIDIIRTATNLEFDIEKEMPDLDNAEYIEIMIKNDIIKVTPENCNIIIQSGINNLKKFISVHCNAFCLMLATGDVKIDYDKDLVELLSKENEENSEADKLNIVKSLNGPVPCNIAYFYSIPLCKEFLRNHLDVLTMDVYFIMYDKISDEDFKEEIFRTLANNEDIRQYKHKLETKHLNLYDRLKQYSKYLKN